MELKIYCIKDNLKGQLDNATLHINDGLALRQFSNWINDKGMGLLASNTADFSIYCLGTLETETGVITPKVDFICHCIDLKGE